jgi:hypothetical protein
MAGKAKRGRQSPMLAPLPDGMKLIPIAVYGCWVWGSWRDLDEKHGYFTVSDGKVYHVQAGKTFNEGGHEIGTLPDGWDAIDLNHLESNSGGYFVGPKEHVEEARRLQNERFAADRAVGELIYHEGAY